MQDVSQEKYHQLQVVSTGKLVLRYSIPVIINMVAISLHNLIGSILIGNGVGTLAIFGFAITFPMMNCPIAFNTLVGIGGIASISISLGRRQYEQVADILYTVVIFGFVISVLAGWITYPNLDAVLHSFGASEATLPYVQEYIEISLCANPITFLFSSLNNLPRRNGFPKKSLESTLLTVGLNLVLTSVFISVLEFGIKGVSMSTVISQIIGLVWVVRHFSSKLNKIHFQRSRFRRNFCLSGEIMKLRTPPLILNLCSAFISIAPISRFGFYGGDFAIGIYGIVNRVCMLLPMIIIGLAAGMQPIIGYNLGTGQTGRIDKAMNTGLTIAFALMLSVFLLYEMGARSTIQLFSNETALNDIAVTGLRICALMFPVTVIQTMITNLFQSIDKPKTSTVLSFIRQIGFFTLLISLLPEMSDLRLDGVWLSIPIAGFIACILTVSVYLRYRQRSKKFAMDAI